MITGKEKNFSGSKMQLPPTLPKSELKYLPKYIAYKAALLREKLVLNYVIAVLTLLLIALFVVTRFEISGLYEQVRTKEYILAPGAQDFTTVSPQSVPDNYINSAVTDFVSSLGNVNASNVIQEYEGLKLFMSDSFRIKFDAETREWVQQIRNEDLAQILKVKSQEIVSDQNGAYKVTVFARADFYMGGQYLGHEDQVIEMQLALVPPDREKRWYLQITGLTWSKLEAFQKRSDYQDLKQ